MSGARGQDWQKGRLDNGRILFDEADGMEQALADGFFFVTRPPRLDLAAGDRFARSFYLPRTPEEPDEFRGFQDWTAEQLGPRQGYFSREVDQTEQFFLASSHWRDVYPPDLAAQAAAMRDFAVRILTAILRELALPAELWDKATGGSLSGRGTYTLTFNHFRPHVRARGLNIHKDSGWVTVLRSLEPGLEVERAGAWHPIDPSPDTFIVNFGCAMEILTRGTRRPVSAVAHRVVEQPEEHTHRPDRFSYALFVDSSLDSDVCPGLFRYVPESGLVLETSFRDFLDTILENTYRSGTTGLY